MRLMKQQDGGVGELMNSLIYPAGQSTRLRPPTYQLLVSRKGIATVHCFCGLAYSTKLSWWAKLKLWLGFEHHVRCPSGCGSAIAVVRESTLR